MLSLRWRRHRRQNDLVRNVPKARHDPRCRRSARTYRLLNHGPVTLVTSAHGERRNIMAAAWAMPLDFDPPKVAVVIDKSTLTRELIEASGVFVLNVPCRAQARATLDVGSISGRDLADSDKFTHFGLATRAGTAIAVPLLEGASAGWNAAWSASRTIRAATIFSSAKSCRQCRRRRLPRRPLAFRGRPEAKRTLHYVAGGAFYVIGETSISGLK